MFDDLDPSLTLVRTSSSDGFTCTNTEPLTCTLPSLAANDSASFTVTVRVSRDAPLDTTMLNTATVTSSTPDLDPANSGTASIRTVVCTITATPFRPVIGTPGDDVIIGNASNNPIVANGGADRICGGGGNDTVSVGVFDGDPDHILLVRVARATTPSPAAITATSSTAGTVQTP